MDLRHSLRALLLIFTLGICTGSFANDGQLILVSGEVTLQRTVAGSSAQALVPVTGSRVQAGDALVTGATGRAQIRFSDGSLLSLQPRSEFRIDEYRFDMTQQRGFFALVRGALRTISGAIGKRDPDDYRMTTPTATIGIRGTEFVVEETVCTPACQPGRTAGLRVAVSAGRVVVFNAAGSIEVPAGSATYVAGPANAPVPTSERPTLSTAPASFDPTNPAGTVRLAGTLPGITAGPDGGRLPGARSSNVAGSPTSRLEPRATGAAASNITLRNTQGDTGSRPEDQGERVPDPLADSLAGSLSIDGVPPALLDQWRTALLRERVKPVTVAPQPVALAEPTLAGTVTPTAGPARTTPPKASRSTPPDTPAPGARKDSDEAQTAPAQGAPGDTPTPSGSGDPVASDPITILALSPSGDGTLTAPINGSTGSNSQIDPATGVPVAIGSNGACLNGQCIAGGKAGSGGSGTDGTDGTAGGSDGGTGAGAGTGTGGSGGGTPGDGTPVGGGPEPGNPGTGNPGSGAPPVLTPGLNEAGQIAVRTLQSPWFDLNLNAANANVHLDSAYRLESIGLCPFVFCLARNTAQVVESGHFSDVAWGRWVSGSARLTVLGLQTNHTLGSNDGVHYLVGVPTVTMPTSGSANYSLAGATSPTFASGAVTPGVFTGQGLVQFGAGQETRVGFKGDMTFGSGEHYHLFSNGARTDATGRLVEIGDTQMRMTGRTTFSGNIGVVSQGNSDRLGCGGSNCQAQVSGGFYGSQAARMGIGYSVGRAQGGGDTINGVAVLNRE